MEGKGEIGLDFYPRGCTILVFLTRGVCGMSRTNPTGDSPLVQDQDQVQGGATPIFNSRSVALGPTGGLSGNFILKFCEITGLSDRSCKTLSQPTDATREGAGLNPETGSDTDIPAATGETADVPGETSGDASINALAEKLKGGKELEPGWLRKFFMKIGAALGKDSMAEKVRQYELNQFKNLLKKDKGLRDNFVSFAKNFAGECTSKELPKVFAVVKELLGAHATAQVEVREAFIQQATHLAGECSEAEFPEFFADVKDLLGGNVDTVNEFASHCTRENFSKVFTGMKGLLGASSDLRWSCEVRGAFIHQATHLAGKCNEENFSAFFAEVKELFKEDQSSWTWSGGIREAFIQQAIHLAENRNEENFSAFFAEVKDLLGENEVDVAKELASHCTMENFSKIFTGLKASLNESSTEWREQDGVFARFVNRAKDLALECATVEDLRFFNEVKDLLGKDSPEWKGSDGVREAFIHSAKRVASGICHTLSRTVDKEKNDFTMKTLGFILEMKNLLGEENPPEWQGVENTMASSAMYFANCCTLENFSEIFNKVRDLAGERYLKHVRGAFNNCARQLARECKPGEWTDGSFDGIKAALGGEDSEEWKIVEAEYSAAHKGR
jgi:hypothetical protein